MIAKVHEKNHDEANHPNNPEPDLETHLPDDSYPMQDSDIEDLLQTHGHYSAKMTSTYHISKHSASSYGSLVDRGANGGLAGADVHVLERTGTKVSVTGIVGSHQVPFPMCTLETLQKYCSTSSLLLNFCLSLL